jgi:hypothetical protein
VALLLALDKRRSRVWKSIRYLMTTWDEVHGRSSMSVAMNNDEGIRHHPLRRPRNKRYQKIQPKFEFRIR